MNVKEKFKEYCEKVLNKPFQDIKSIKSYDDSTLFCSAGLGWVAYNITLQEWVEIIFVY